MTMSLPYIVLSPFAAGRLAQRLLGQSQEQYEQLMAGLKEGVWFVPNCNPELWYAGLSHTVRQGLCSARREACRTRRYAVRESTAGFARLDSLLQRHSLPLIGMEYPGVYAEPAGTVAAGARQIGYKVVEFGTR